MSNWTYGFDIESIGLPNRAKIGKATVRGDIKSKLFSIALSEGGTMKPAFLGQTVVPKIFSMQEFLRLGETGSRSHSLDISHKGVTNKMLDYLQAQGYHTPGSNIMAVNSAQKAYLGNVVSDGGFFKKFISPTQTEITKHGGTLYKSGESALIQDFSKRMQDIADDAFKAGAKPTLVGHNINRFDIPFIMDRLRDTDPPAAKRFQETLKRFNIVDTAVQAREKIRHAHLGAPEHLSGNEVVQQWRQRPERARGWNLDVVSKMLGKARDSVTAHGPLEDAALSVQAMEGMQGRVFTSEEHLAAMDTLGVDPKPRTPDFVEQLPDPHPPQKVTASPKLPKISARGMFQKVTKGKLAAFGGAVGAGYLLFGNDETVQSVRSAGDSLANSIMNPVARRTDYISSSTLGLTRFNDLVGRVYDPVLGDQMKNESPNKRLKGHNIVEAGNFMHSMIQRNMMAAGTAAETEKYVEDVKNKVFGYVDVIQKGGIPLEIKTVSEQALRSMRAPKPTAVSQANFYALALESPVAQIMYVAREAPQMRKTFTISADPGKYLNDVENIRQIQEQFKDAPSSKPYLSSFRPLRSWFGGGMNYNMPYSKRSNVASQRLTLADLPVANHWPQENNRNHVNSSRAGVI